MERYEKEGDRYVLYVDGLRGLCTDVVALLVDAARGTVVTHGDPRSVRRECDELRAVAPAECRGWLLLEGRPELRALNRALQGKIDLVELHHAFIETTHKEVDRLARELLARIGQKRMT